MTCCSCCWRHTLGKISLPEEKLISLIIDISVFLSLSLPSELIKKVDSFVIPYLLKSYINGVPYTTQLLPSAAPARVRTRNRTDGIVQRALLVCSSRESAPYSPIESP